MTPLERALRERIETEGPITVEAYMEACNTYYYATRDPLGAHGDFTTAPEISQMFGEMCGAALADCWIRSGRPLDAIFVELGPGRGTLAADALRMLHHAGFSGEIHFVETSPALRDLQREKVPGAQWHDSLEDLPAKPLLLIANEFLDALPIRQHVGERERHVLVLPTGLAFDRSGEIIETSPARDLLIMAIATCLAAAGGAAILIDYGHWHSVPGDTLQAVRSHQHAPVLDQPGEQDLTSHVDFEQVAKIAEEAGASVTRLVNQGAWLIRLGIESRAKALCRANPDRLHDVEAALERLTSPDLMGNLFKTIAIHARHWPAPLGYE